MLCMMKKIEKYKIKEIDDKWNGRWELIRWNKGRRLNGEVLLI
jgi:hypothetical protein